MSYKKLASMPYAQAVVDTNSHGDRCLISYTTPVAYIFIRDDGEWLYCRGLYSATTRKHISAFARENGYCYSDFKTIAATDTVFNPLTGEVMMGDRFTWTT